MKKVISCEYVIQEINKVFSFLLANNKQGASQALYTLRQSCNDLDSSFRGKTDVSETEG